AQHAHCADMTPSLLRSGALQALPLAVVVFGSGCALDDQDAPTTTMTEAEIRVANHKQTCDRTHDEGLCHARIVVNATGGVATNAAPAGLGPAQLRSAYKLTSSGTSAIAIAIVDAFGYPNAESDLATYRSQFGLPACTSASGCFRKVDQ